MEWFRGDLANAVASVKNARSILTVFVAEGEESNWDDIWDAESVHEEFKDHVCIRLCNGSEGLAHFKNVYPVPIVPSIYFISFSGKIVQMIAQKINSDGLIERFNIALRGVESEKNSPRPESSEANSENTSVSKEALARKKLEEIRKAKEALAMEEEREREKQRIANGKRLLEAERKRKELQDKQMLEDIRKEKEAQKAAKDAIKRQIELDRLERKKKFAPKASSSPVGSPANMSAAASSSSINSEGHGDVASILFRLTDGSTIRNQFSKLDTLADAKIFCEQNRTDVAAFGNIPSQRGQFHMLTTFPNRIFTDDDLNKTFAELGFVPSGSLIIKQKSSSTENSAPNFGAVLSNVWSYISMWISYIVSLILPGSSSPSQRPEGRNERSETAANRNSVKPTAPVDGEKGKGNSSGIRKRNQGMGNVYGLDRKDDPDSESSFNGNSTVHSHDE
eukprot:Nk52_evm20s222 gene=Nk52_evmTU20s222